jgi:hypothetical protein
MASAGTADQDYEIDETCLVKGRMDEVPSRATALGHEETFKACEKPDGRRNRPKFTFFSSTSRVD